VSAKYDKIGVGYNQTRKADSYLLSKLKEHLSPTKEGIYLDIGCGTGNYTNALYEMGYNFIGIDPSKAMLDIAYTRNAKIDWRIGNAEETGLPKNSIHGIIGTLTIHHWTNLFSGCSELYRILQEKGVLVLFTATPEQMKGYWLNHYFPKMLKDSIVQMPSFKQISEALRQAGFSIQYTEAYDIQPDIEDKFLYCGKQNPQYYLDASIRNGISSFSDLANSEEVVKGLALLANDIKTGEIGQIMESYLNSLGDYLYIIAKK